MAVLERKECTRCGRDWNLPPNSGGCACEFLLPHEATVVRYVSEADVERLREVIQEYAQHDSWRCGHPDRYPQDEDCPCGLLSTLRDAGRDWERWRAYPDAS